MAVLKDLIVHGASRFINPAHFGNVQASNLTADNGYFNFIKTVDGQITGTLDVNDLQAQTARVAVSLDVDGVLNTKSWSNANIAEVGGNFYISPTLKYENNVNACTINLTRTLENSNYTYRIIVSGGSFDATAVRTYEENQWTAGVWKANSKVMVTGEIKVTINNEIYPLGTCVGILESNLTGSNESGFTVKCTATSTIKSIFEVAQYTTSGNVDTISGTSNKVEISLYQKAPNSGTADADYKPIGILLTSYGLDKRTYIDIYGGVNKASTGQSGGFSGMAMPNVRIGNLEGLPNIVSNDLTDNATLPRGWGIYTDNGYFKGTIVSSSGLIGNFTIGANLHSGTGGIGVGNNVYVSPGTFSPNQVAGSPAGQIWAFTAGESFGVTTGGVLYATSGHISGSVTIGTTSINQINDVASRVKIDKGGIILGDEKSFHIFIDGRTTEGVPTESYTYGLGFYQGSHNPYDLSNDTTVQNGKTYYILGDNGYEEVINPSGNPKTLEYYEKTDKRIAYINYNKLSIPYSVVLKGMELGTQWRWELDDATHNLSLKWIG